MKKLFVLLLSLTMVTAPMAVAYAEETAGPTELIITSGEKTIYGLLYEPTVESNHTVIIMSHGYNGSMDVYKNEGPLFAANGYTAYTYEFCGGRVGSRSSGKSSDMTITSEKEDLLDVINYFKGLEDTEKIFLLGESQGGFVSSLVAADLKDEIGALAMYYPALCIPDNWLEMYPDPEEAEDTFDFWGLELGKGFIYDVQAIDVFGTIGDYKGDVLIIHGDEDAVVPYEYSEKAEETYENATLVKMPGENHGWTEEVKPEVAEMVLEFFNEH